MITAWNWILLTDFASFKPTFLPEDNPAEFSYFFDTSRRYLFQAYSNFSCQITFCSSTFRYFDIFSYFFDIRRICYIAPERFKTRTITVEAATNPTLSTSIISDETPEADGEGDGELLPSMDIFSGTGYLIAKMNKQFSFGERKGIDFCWYLESYVFMREGHLWLFRQFLFF